MKLILFLILFLASTLAHSQSLGSAQVTLHFNREASNVNGFIILNNELYEKNTIDFGINIFNLDSVIPGNYSLLIIKESDTLYRFNEIKVNENCLAEYEYTIERTINCEEEDTSSSAIELMYFLEYGNPSFIKAQNKYNSHLFSLGFTSNAFLNRSKVFSQAISIGVKYALNQYRPDSSKINNMNIKREYINNLGLKLALFNRISFFDMRRYNEDEFGLFIDLGISYDLPIICKNTKYLGDNTRLKKGSIHNFKEAGLFIRISYMYFGLYANYLPFKYYNSSMPTDPPLRFGINLTVPD